MVRRLDSMFPEGLVKEGIDVVSADVVENLKAGIMFDFLQSVHGLPPP